MGGNIPFTAIVDFARIYNIANFEEFRYIIRSMESEYIRRTDKKAKDNGNSNGNTDDYSQDGRQVVKKS